MSSSQLTNSYVSEGWPNHQADRDVHNLNKWVNDTRFINGYWQPFIIGISHQGSWDIRSPGPTNFEVGWSSKETTPIVGGGLRRWSSIVGGGLTSGSQTHLKSFIADERTLLVLLDWRFFFWVPWQNRAFRRAVTADFFVPHRYVSLVVA